MAARRLENNFVMKKPVQQRLIGSLASISGDA